MLKIPFQTLTEDKKEEIGGYIRENPSSFGCKQQQAHCTCCGNRSFSYFYNVRYSSFENGRQIKTVLLLDEDCFMDLRDGRKVLQE
jgi:hypothetical protein